jgi:diguanylate cyclase (GGDEF)-like protein
MIFKRVSLSARFALTVIVLFCIFGLGIGFLIRSLFSIESLLEQESARHVQELTVNSMVSREIFELSSRVRLLEQTFLYDESILSEEGFNIDEQLQNIRALSEDELFVLRMDEFIVDFHRFIGNSVTLNRILKELSVIDTQLGQEIDQLDSELAKYFVTQAISSPKRPFSDELDIMHFIRETYLSAGKMAASVRSRITPDTEQVVIIKVEKELNILAMHLTNMRRFNEDVSQAQNAIQRTIRRYRAALRKMTANLDQRWSVMGALVDSQTNLIGYVANTEQAVQRSAIRISNDVKTDLIVMRAWVFISSFVALFFGITITLMMVKRHITKPLKELKSSFHQVEQNNFDHPVRLNRLDEWEVIESAFNRMSARLKRTYSDLEDERSKLNVLAHQDPLTGLANRLLIYKRLNKATQGAGHASRVFSILYLDIDHFKTVNDSLGHNIGDELLIEVARRLKQLTQGQDIVSRLGGDEFMILCYSAKTMDSVTELARAINESLRQPFNVESETVFVSSSIGVCLYPEHGDTAETLVRNADTAMYHAKRGGRDDFRVYKHSMTSEAHEVMSKSSGLKRALINNELFVVYQPQYDTFSGRIFGAEALVRWNHPSKGILRPAEFLDIAEQTGIIVDLDDYVFNLIFEDLLEWTEQGAIDDDFKVSVNFSGRKLFSEQLLQHLTERHEQAPTVAQRITLELTERDMITNIEQCQQSIEQIKLLGFKIAIDDFGTGYSSLATLKHLPVDVLKLDRSFISGLGDASVDYVIIESILSIAKGLNLQAIAEGVETDLQLQSLKNIGCNAAQGYYLSYPIDKEELLQLLAEQKAG